MKKLIAVALCLGLSLTSGCQSMETTKTAGLSTEEKSEDFEELKTLLDDLYPFFGEYESLGLKVDELYAKYEQQALETQSDVDFMNCINSLFMEFQAKGSLGHLSLINAYYYDWCATIYTTAEGMEPWKELLSNEQTAEAYGKLDKTKPRGFAEKTLLSSLKKNSTGAKQGLSDQKVQMKMLENGKIPYVYIPTFDGIRMEKDGAKIAEFIANNSNCSDLIIDIRGNGGGNSNYWYKYIVAPNITENKKTANTFLVTEKMMQNEQIQKFAQNEIPGSLESAKPIEQMPEFANLTAFAKNFDYYIERTEEWAAETCDKPFKGKIWLLTNQGNGSASEQFVNFARQTGFAKTVGAPTGGDGCMMDPSLFTLKNSRLIIRFDAAYPLNSDGSSNAVQGEPADYPSPSDKALGRCLDLIKAGK